MQKVVIIGNITKDIYLRLDNRVNKFEEDEHHVKWLDFAFNGSSHNYFSRVAIYGGASISLEVLSRFGLKAEISGAPATFLDGQFVAKDSTTVYRYILCQDDNVSYIAPSHHHETTWKMPKDDTPDWIYIDRSANVTPNLVRELMDYLDIEPSCKIAFFISENVNQYANHIRELAEHAALIITDTKLDTQYSNVVKIFSNTIEYNGKSITWSLNGREDLMTHLSTHLTIGATILGAIILGKSPSEAILLAKANAEGARLSGTLNIDTLEAEIADDYYKIQGKGKDPKVLELEANAKKLMTPGKGILAADESGGSIHKKFESMNIPDDEQHRRDYRNIFFTTPELEKYVNGVILFDETARQHADDGSTFVDFLTRKGIIAGIKVDQGLVNFENSPEKYTQGLDGLPERLKEYYDMGARFAKWRAAFEMNQDLKPSDMAIKKNAEILSHYASYCQAAGIVPIVEPELVYDGYYTIEQNIEYTGKILDALFEALRSDGVNLAACILKVNMVLAGKKYETQSTPAEVGKATADVLRDHVPSSLAGVVFLSGGQTVEQATENLQEVTNNGPFPWPVTFSFARALQDPALKAWQGNNDNADAAREGFKARLIANCEALIKK